MTPFSKIVPLIYDELKKTDLFTSDYLDTELKLDELSRLILKGALVDFTTCKKELENYVEYADEKVYKTITGDVNELDINVTEIDRDKNEVILYINNVEITDFTYNITNLDENYNCHIEYAFKENDEVEIIFINEGYFKEDLIFREMYIIALGASYHYMDSKIKEEEKWIKKLGDKDYSLSRGSIGDYTSLNKDIKDNLVIYIQKYNEQMSTVEDFM